MATEQQVLDAHLARLQAQTVAANRSLIDVHATLTASLLNDRNGPTGRNVAAASAEASEILRASAKAVTQANFWTAS